MMESVCHCPACLSPTMLALCSAGQTSTTVHCHHGSRMECMQLPCVSDDRLSNPSVADGTKHLDRASNCLAMFWHAIFVLAGLLTVGVGAQPEPEQHNPLEAFQNSQWSSDLSYSAYNISLKVSSTSLPAEGGWVDVTWDNVPYPGSDDLIALYIPADADPRKTTFAKYQWAIASPEHLPHGKGRLRSAQLVCLTHMHVVRITHREQPGPEGMMKILRMRQLRAQ